MEKYNGIKTDSRIMRKLTGAVFIVLLFSILISIGGIKARADEGGMPTIINSCIYNPDTDSIEAVQECYIYALRRESGNNIKPSTKYTPMVAGKTVTLTALGRKSTSKDVYLLVVGSPIKEKMSGISANMKISAQKVRKFNPIIDYTLVNYDDGIVKGGCPWSFLSAELKDKSKTVISDYTLLWSEKATGDFYPVIGVYNEDTHQFEHTLDGEYLASKVSNGTSIYVKVRGTSDQTEEENIRTSKAYKVRIQKQAKAPSVVVDAANETIGFRNGMDFAVAYQDSSAGYMPVAYNDGYSVTWDDKTYTGDQYVYKWYTILPFERTASTNSQYESIVSGSRNGIRAKEGVIQNNVCRDNGTVGLYNINGFFIPRDKRDSKAKKGYDESGDNSVSYTSFSFGKIDYWDVVSFAGSTDTVMVVRKSPTAKQPGSRIATIKLTYHESAPLVYTETNVADEFLITSGDRLMFKMPKVINSPAVEQTENKRVGAVWNEPGEDGEPVPKNDYEKYKNEYSYIRSYTDSYYDFENEKWVNYNTKGFYDTFEAEPGTDKLSSFYEFAVVSADDYYYKDKKWYDNVDWSTVTWKRINPETGIVSEKLCTLYKNNDGIRRSVKLNAATVDREVTNINTDVTISDASTIMLIRRAFSGTNPASKWVCTYIVNVDGKFYWMSNVANGDYAYPYTINFAVFDKETQTYKVDDALSIKGYAKNNKENTFKCPDIGVIWTADEGEFVPELTNISAISDCVSGRSATFTSYMTAPASAGADDYYVTNPSKIPVGSRYEAVIKCDRCSDLTIYRSLQNKIDGTAFSLDSSISLNTSSSGNFRTCLDPDCTDGEEHYFLANHKYEVTAASFAALDKPGFVIDLAASVDGKILTVEGSGESAQYFLNVPDEPSTLSLKYNFETINVGLYTYMENENGLGSYVTGTSEIGSFKAQKGIATVVGASMIPAYEGYEFVGIKTGDGFTPADKASEINGSHYITTTEPVRIYLQYNLCTYRSSIKTDTARGGTYGVDVRNSDKQIIGCKYGVAKEVTESMLPTVENYLIDWDTTLANNSCLKFENDKYYITLTAESVITVYYRIQ